jgi:hypothetical protein
MEARVRKQHLLQELKFPANYERLEAALGQQVARLLVQPGQQTNEAFEEIAHAITQEDVGLLCPIYARPGTGKTTLAENLDTFHYGLYGSTLAYAGPLKSAELVAAVGEHRSAMSANDDRITPINVDSREMLPPDATEMAELKQFVRTDEGARTVILWPTTSLSVAEEMGTRYTDIVSGVPVELPVHVGGPPKESWRQIAAHTLRLVNGVESLELLINPDDYNPEEHRSIGDFLRAMSKDFMARRLELLRSTRKPLTVTIVFGSESTDAGVLSQVTSGTRYGLLDGSALIGICKDSEIAKWWEPRRGLLTQTIVQLEAHAFAIAPTTTISVLRQFGNEVTKKDLTTLKFKPQGVGACNEALGRSDLGRHLRGEQMAAYEARGNPGDASVAAFSLLVEDGLISGNRDREVNKAMAAALIEFLSEDDDTRIQVKAEKQVEGTQLIGDVQVLANDITHCIEFAWRKGEFMLPKNRSASAIYILRKLKSYATAMGWAGTE